MMLYKSMWPMMLPLQFFITALVLLLLTDNCCPLANEKKPFLRRIRSTIAPFSLPWYEDGLQFDCTGCGKCCKVDGDVWLAPEEVSSIMLHLGYSNNGSSIDEFRKKYVRAEVVPSNNDESDQPQSWMCLKRNEGACIFLNPIGQCSIYAVRPLQCSTYPFWPSIVSSRDAWDEESVLPDDVDIREGTNDRHWTSEMGGCEGIRRHDVDPSMDAGTDDDYILLEASSIVPRQEILTKMKAAKNHWKRFPVQEIKENTWYL